MRKYHKEQLLQLVSTLHIAHKEIKKLIENHNYERVNEMLIECQEAAIHMGNSIERSEGEGLSVITCIENYCEALYNVSLTVESSVNANKEYKILNKHMIGIQTGIQNEIKLKREIVFLPYKASMWDSLESIWLAAKDDEDCDCYVIPIPYFNRTLDGGFGEMHYEGNLMPDYVPITNYTEYNLSVKKPDVIYFHNPYDQYNYVTSVHPVFYSSELKKCTDMLVYVPYYVSIENVAEAFCATTGVLNADKVIVQSEKIKETYVRVFMDVLGESEKEKSGYSNTEFWRVLKDMADEKFLVLGSPKIDKVVRSNQKNIHIPNEWTELIGLDGSRKKVILYNTHLDGLLNKGEEFLNKLQYVFSIFEKQNKVVLLWRPHPLSEQTLASMVPQNLQKYKELEREYKEKKIGIFDDTEDLHRAIAISDAYYGDMSSLVAMYGVTGKPILLENMDINIDKIKEYNEPVLRIEEIYDDGICRWFTAANYNGLFRMADDCKKIENIDIFENEPLLKKGLYGEIVEYDEKLVFTPKSANQIAIYDRVSEKMSYIPFKVSFTSENVNYGNEIKFFSGVRYKKYVYFFGYIYPAIIKVCMHTGEVSYITEWINDSNLINIDHKYGYFQTSKIVNGDMVLLPFTNTNAVMEFDMKTGKSKIYTIEKSKSGFMGMTFDGQAYWLITRETGTIIKWYKETNTVMEYNNIPTNIKSRGCKFYRILYLKNKIWLFAHFANMNLVIKSDTDEIYQDYTFEQLNSESICKYEKIGCRYPIAYARDNQITVLDSKSNELITVNLDTEKVETNYIGMPIEYQKIIKEEILRDTYVHMRIPQDCIFRENPMFDLTRLIKIVGNEEIKLNSIQIKLFSKSIKNSDGTCGSKIHNIILRRKDVYGR
jgi:hypothetical protein